MKARIDFAKVLLPKAMQALGSITGCSSWSRYAPHG